MGKYISNFATTAEFEAAESSLATPHVSLTREDMTVHYIPLPPTPSYESVDLGLPSGTKWAKYNVGATSETEYGNYYQYGKGAAQYAATSGDSNYSGTENPLATSADTAAQEWGGSWHMPTMEQMEELTANTTYEWTTINGVNGGKFTAKNGSGNYIFIPAAGYYGNGSPDEVGSDGYVWSSTHGIEDACNLGFGNGYKFVTFVPLEFGILVRPVMDA